ncbi:sugar transferase [Pseudonocardia sp. KRD-184]|uniref:Sugar transferase n=1 Tax=Pseudonocardia oceani TaxID=2792013 RepID=A0ABS6U5G9_9PSEU|nr:sugar transferase [Pseudonocardia oceani]MBW0089581.1 sugar transferase [Pseudonocardia oceani]MBW0096507.1 sugar transferase [Pseudonocardia oceani]MBW0122752.1 sugar transferase [Pseudonocardia oceani]MBW0127479.1 sugar transferase [Pseudonocardia oceani]
MTVIAPELLALGSAVVVAALIGLGWPVPAIGGLMAVGTLFSGSLQWRFHPNVLDDLPEIVRTAVAVTFVVAVAPVLAGTDADLAAHTRLSLVVGASALAGVVIGRGGAYALVRRGRRRGLGRLRAIVIGTGATGSRIERALAANPALGADVVGFIDDGVELAPGFVPLGDMNQLADIVSRLQIQLIIVAQWRGSSAVAVDPLRSMHGLACDIFVLPRFHELHDDASKSQIVAGLPLVRLRRSAFRRGSWRVKRVFDVCSAALALVIVGPVMLGVALAVRLETGPGVIFRQQRIGLNGRVFTLYKFRSLAPVGDEAEVRWNIDGDTRMGPVGRIIRASSLDELPQLVNILKGDMSIVGPRPERPHFVDEFSRDVPGYQHRHRMPAGLTGLAVVRGLRGDTSIRDRAHYDNLYAESWSLWLDIKIIIRTAGHISRSVLGRKSTEPMD